MRVNSHQEFSEQLKTFKPRSVGLLANISQFWKKKNSECFVAFKTREENRECNYKFRINSALT